MSRRNRKRKAGDKPAGAPARESSPEGGRIATAPAKAAGQQPNLSSKEFAAWAAVLLFLYCFLATWGQFDFSNLMGYYSMLADALLAGRLSIGYTPDEVHLIDMVPFEGRYYLQWGPVPALFHVLAKLGGGELSDRVACILAGWHRWHFCGLCWRSGSDIFHSYPYGYAGRSFLNLLSEARRLSCLYGERSTTRALAWRRCSSSLVSCFFLGTREQAERLLRGSLAYN